MLAKPWIGQNPAGWLMSEKLNGFRAIWNGHQLISRGGNPFLAPAWFTSSLPAGVPVDGELWAGRDGIRRVQSAVQSCNQDGWRGVRFMAYDLPASELAAENRIDVLATFTPTDYFSVLEQRVCFSLKDMVFELTRIAELGGEGLVLRQANAQYHHSAHDRNYTDRMLKVRCADNCNLLPLRLRWSKEEWEAFISEPKEAEVCLT